MNPGLAHTWTLTDARAITLDRPCVVCILNATPDSFSDGGLHDSIDAAVDRAKQAIDEGADMLDIGGESTRPGAERINAHEQTRRVVPIIEGIRAAGHSIPISIDTTLSPVARAALDSGADAINDVSGMTEDLEMLPLAADRGCGVILMHRLTDPTKDSYSDQYDSEPAYGDVVSEVCGALDRLKQGALDAGVGERHIVLDPGLGFGKSVEDNLALIAQTHRLLGLGSPILSGLSRKSFVGRAALGRDSEPSERVRASVGMSVMHLISGARIFRVHDVAVHRQALDSAWAVMSHNRANP